MEKQQMLIRMSIVCGMALVAWSGNAPSAFATEVPERPRPLRIVERSQSDEQPPIYHAFYSTPTGLELIGPKAISGDAGRTWKPFQASPDFSTGLPYGYRRDETFPSVVDTNNGRMVKVYNALDTPGVDPKIVEPRIRLKEFYVRYRVSTDCGRTYLFDEPVVREGHTSENPFDGVMVGKNGIFFGDCGSVPIFNRRGELLVPLQLCLLDEDGELSNPGGGSTYHDVLIAIGVWAEENRMLWKVSERVKGDPAKTTRGLYEPTLAELPDGRILMVMRGSNGGRKDRGFRIPSHKWMSVSEDGGHSWSAPKPWTYDSGRPFYSPSSMSRLIKHSSGRIFWVGNICPSNARGNSPRWPLVIGEVDAKTLRLIESSLLTVDARRPEDPREVPGSTKGRLDICHAWAIEDRKTGDILLTYPRAMNAYQQRHWIQCRIGL